MVENFPNLKKGMEYKFKTINELPTRIIPEIQTKTHYNHTVKITGKGKILKKARKK